MVLLQSFSRCNQSLKRTCLFASLPKTPGEGEGESQQLCFSRKCQDLDKVPVFQFSLTVSVSEWSGFRFQFIFKAKTLCQDSGFGVQVRVHLWVLFHWLMFSFMRLAFQDQVRVNGWGCFKVSIRKRYHYVRVMVGRLLGQDKSSTLLLRTVTCN